jgi:hypothetical protein
LVLIVPGVATSAAVRPVDPAAEHETALAGEASESADRATTPTPSVRPKNKRLTVRLTT